MKKNPVLLRIISGAVLLAIGIVSTHPTYRLALCLSAYVIVGYDVLLNGLRNLRHIWTMDESLLMCISTIGAFIIGEYPEGVAVMLFFKIGEMFEDHAVDKSRKSIAELMDIRPDSANLLTDGQVQTVDPYDVQVGEIIVVKAGERIPLDARVIRGGGLVDTSALTGESVPREVTVGSEILSGCISVNGLLEAEVTKEFGESTASKILDLVENASSKKSRSESFITKFARYYTPAVVLVALLLALIPPLAFGGELREWAYRALTFLVISCPCALVISVPLSFFGGIGGASRQGILVKGGNYLEAMANAETVVFDKTGTLTRGVFSVHEVSPVGMEPEALLELAALAECCSNHPLSQSLQEAWGKPLDSGRVTDAKELPGMGVSASVDGKLVLAGNTRLMKSAGINLPDDDIGSTVVHTAVDGNYAGHISISDELKDDAGDSISALNKNGIRRIVMLTGDVESVGKRTAAELGIGEVYCGLLPDGKVSQVEQLLNATSSKGSLIFVGDGINDAPVLARADIGIAMGGLGSDAAIEAADVVIMTDEPSKVATAISLAGKTLRIVKQNIVFALGIKAIALILGALGYLSMWVAVFADVGVSVIAILNALRALNFHQPVSSHHHLMQKQADTQPIMDR